MRTLTRTSTTEMEVTSIRLEKSLKDKLKDLSGNQGYQALIRDILWNYVHQKSGDYRPQFSAADIRSTIAATARRDESCALTGKLISENESMLLGLTIYGDLVPLSMESLVNS
jgi:metal-responsive CopG/Arc/MetJ family transcriptional regulator